MAIPSPAENYWLAPELDSHDKDAPRPHVVLSPTDQNDIVVTLAFGTKSDLQATRHNAPHIIVDRNSATFGLSGLNETTYFYPSRLVVALLKDVPGKPAGRIVDEYPELRDVQLPKALGLGTTSTDGKTLATAGRRGSIAIFSDWFSESIGTPYGAVVTWPPYSSRRQVQNVVPLFDAKEFEEVEPNFSASSEPWVSQLRPWRSVLFMVQLIQGAYDGGDEIPQVDKDIIGYLEQPIDPLTMSTLDEALASRLFGMPLVDVLGEPDK